MKIDTIMIFAAGFGSRMKGITKDLPKPLIEVGGKPFLHHVLEFCVQSGRFKQIIINAHYLPHLISESVEKFKLRKNSLHEIILPEIIIIEEKDYIRETGGAVKNAKDYVGNSDAIFTINSDSIIYSSSDVFDKMEEFWNSRKMDFLLLLSRRIDVVGESVGDFDFDEQINLLSRTRDRDLREFTYTGLQIMRPSVAINYEDDVFAISKLQINPFYKSYGVLNEGKFLHANSEEHIKEIEKFWEINPLVKLSKINNE